MRTRIDENAQEALQFLMLGSGIVLGARLLYLGALHFVNSTGPDALHLAIANFDHGYLLGGNSTLVVQGMAPGGRLAMALVLSIIGGIVLALIGGGMARIFKADGRRWAVLGARAGLVIAGAWGVYAALTLPPVCTVVREDGVLLRSRPAFLGALSWPVLPQETFLSWESIEAIETRSVASGYDGCGSHEQVVALSGSSTYALAGLIPEGRDCNEALHSAQAETKDLVIVLEPFLAR
jgi:hypothetical protein